MLLCGLQAEQPGTAGRKVLAAPARTEIAHTCSNYLPLFLLYFILKAGLSQFLLAMPFHRAQDCVNVPAQRLHVVLKPSHLLAKPVPTTTAMSREQETGTETTASHTDLDRQRKTVHQSNPCQSNSALSSISSGAHVHS